MMQVFYISILKQKYIPEITEKLITSDGRHRVFIRLKGVDYSEFFFTSEF